MKILILLAAGIILAYAQDSLSKQIKAPCNTLVAPVCPRNQYFDYNLCQCVCTKSENCLYPGQLNPQSCICDCPWWSYLLCQKNQFLDPKSCQCKCKEPCKDCSRPQVWNANVCNCVCPYKKKCPKSQFWSEWSCDCECKQKPKRCCEMKVWSGKACDCVEKIILTTPNTTSSSTTTTSTSTSTSTSTTPSTTISYPPIDGCNQSMIKPGECLYPGEVKISCNGCFKMMLEGGNLVVYYNNAPGLAPVLIKNYADSDLVRVCSGNSTTEFYAASGYSMKIHFTGPVDMIILDNGQILFAQRNSTFSYIYGTHLKCREETTTSSSTSTTTTQNPSTTTISYPPMDGCDQSIIKYGECLSLGEVKYSCNGCFKMTLEGGNLAVYHNNAPGLPPIWTYYTNNLTVKGCAENPSFVFYRPTGLPIWNIVLFGPVDMRLLDNGYLLFSQRNSTNSQTFGAAASCLITTSTSTTTIDPFVILDQTLTDQQPLLDSMSAAIQALLANPIAQANQALVDCYNRLLDGIEKAKGDVTQGHYYLRYFNLTEANFTVERVLLKVNSVTNMQMITDCQNSAASTTLSPTSTTQVPRNCIGDTIFSGQCLYAGQALCSKNGCFFIHLEGGTLVAARTRDNVVLWRSPYTDGGQNIACSNNTFTVGSFAFNIPKPSDAKLTDDGQLVFLFNSTGEIYQGYNLGIGSTCSSNALCKESIIDVGECFYPGQVKYSCNGCFKMTLEDGHLLVRYNNAPGFHVVLTMSNGQMAKACSTDTGFYFHSASDQLVWGAGWNHPEYSGTFCKILDNGQIVFAAKNTTYSLVSTYGKATSCLTSTTPSTSTTSSITTTTTSNYCIGDTIFVDQCLYPGQALCSKNGCFKAILENGILFCYRTSDMSVVWKSHFTPGGDNRACAGNPFKVGNYVAGMLEPTDAKLTDDGRLIFILKSTGQDSTAVGSNFGIGYSCNSNSTCNESIIDVGECFYPGQVKISCNGCFKMMIENGSFVIYHNNAPGLAPVWTYYYLSGQVVKACGTSTYFTFYKANDEVLLNFVANSNNKLGHFAMVSNTGQFVVAPKNTSFSQVNAYGGSVSCLTSTTLP